GNLTRSLYSDGIDLTFTYDALNRPVKATGLTLGYDAAGRIISSNDLRIDRDEAGRISAITYAAGKTVHYNYSERGLLASLVDWLGGTTVFTWDDAAQMTDIVFANGVHQSISHDGDGRVTAISVQRDSTT